MEIIEKYNSKETTVLEEICREDNPYLRYLYHYLMQHRMGKLPQEQIAALKKSGSLFFELVLSNCEKQMQQEMQQNFIESYDRTALKQFLTQRYQSIMESFSKKVSTLGISKQNLKKEILQQSPSKLIDGFWLERVNQLLCSRDIKEIEVASIMHESIIHLLQRIYEEEEGEGQQSKNHVFLFQRLLKQCNLGTYCDNTTFEFAMDPSITTERFLNPALQLLMGFLQEDYIPELIGFTLSFEQVPESVLEMMHLLEAHHLDNTYYRLHLTIDNNVAGHAAMAEQATSIFMEHVQSMFYKDPKKIQHYWYRIWRGYTLANVCHFSTLLNPTYTLPESNIDEQMKQMLLKYEPFIKGCPFHSKVKSMNKVENREQLLDWLKESGFIEKGSAKKSKLYYSFYGKMFGVFSREDQHLIEQWINSLQKPQFEEKKNLLPVYISLCCVLVVMVLLLFIK